LQSRNPRGGREREREREEREEIEGKDNLEVVLKGGNTLL
jgi:hypothetical protein